MDALCGGKRLRMILVSWGGWLAWADGWERQEPACRSWGSKLQVTSYNAKNVVMLWQSVPASQRKRWCAAKMQEIQDALSRVATCNL